MKNRILISSVLSLTIFNPLKAQVPATQDTIIIPGDIPHSTLHHAGALETTINGDTTAAGARINPNRVYALREGHYYYQNSAINVADPEGTLTIVGVPDSAGTTKPVVLLQPVNGKSVGSNIVYGSIKIVNVHYQAMQLDGTLNGENFYCGTKNQLPQSLTIDNCLFEFSNIDLFDCTNESGAIGGWPYGARFYITNSYFRNLFDSSQWWGSRIFQCKHPIDTLWVENNTIVGGGLTFLQQNELTDFGYFNHNTIINNKKNWLTSLYYRTYFVTNNIFINQSWAGEDTNEISSGADPRKEYQSTIDIDSVNAAEGVVVQPRYLVNGQPYQYSPLLALNKLLVYVSDNIYYYDPLLVSGYYNTTPGTIDSTAYPLSYLGWFYPGVYRVNNIPCQWMNQRTAAAFRAYSPETGGKFIEEHTLMPALSPISYGMTAGVVALMAEWNQYQYNDPRYPSAPDIVHSAYIVGDYNPTTIPGRDSSKNKTENGIGIAKFTDLTENFGQLAVVSTIDDFPLGSLIWDDAGNAAYASAHPGEWDKIYNQYLMWFSTPYVKPQPGVVSVFSLEQNYPNPFNPLTQINFTVPPNNGEVVTLKVYDLLGEEIATLFSGTKSPGNYSAPFDGARYASGVYFYRLQSGSVSFTRKMVLLK